MVSIRHSPDRKGNRELKEVEPKKGETNTRWLERVGARDGLVLLGGNSLSHFRIRIAQSHLRRDLLPSFWSFVGILDGGRTLHSVPLDWTGDASLVPLNNGVRTCRMSDYNDPDRFPNIAVIHFAKDLAAIRRNIEQVRAQRSMVDLPSLMLQWLGFIWGAGQRGNPLLDGHGLPSAAFAETVYGIARIELTPGLSSASSCPEAIWQSAKWWRTFYEETTGPKADPHQAGTIPTGQYGLRQPAATAVEHEGRKR